MIVNGWKLYVHPLFEQQLRHLIDQVDNLAAKNQIGYGTEPAAKLLATINRHIREIIPRDPSSSEFRQGNTLGADNRHWFRAMFHERRIKTATALFIHPDLKLGCGSTNDVLGAVAGYSQEFWIDISISFIGHPNDRD